MYSFVALSFSTFRFLVKLLFLDKKEAKTEAAWELTRYIQLHGHVSIEDVPVRESRAKVSNQRVNNGLVGILKHLSRKGKIIYTNDHVGKSQGISFK